MARSTATTTKAMTAVPAMSSLRFTVTSLVGWWCLTHCRRLRTANPSRAATMAVQPLQRDSLVRGFLAHRDARAAIPARHLLDARAARLDPEALVEHLPRLYRAARAWTDSREEAEDLVQETCARILSRPRFLRGDSELGYLLRALRHTLVSQRRAKSRRPATTPFVEELAAGARAADDPAQAAELGRSTRPSPSSPRSSATPWWPWTSPGSPTPKPPGPCGSRRAR